MTLARDSKLLKPQGIMPVSRKAKRARGFLHPSCDHIAVDWNWLSYGQWVLFCVTESFLALRSDHGLLSYNSHESLLGPDEDLHSSSLTVRFSTTLCFRVGYLQKIIFYDGPGAEE